MKATATLGILVLVTAAACGGGSKNTAAGDTTTPAASAEAASPVPAEPVAPPTGADAARAKSTFAMYPKGVKLVAGASIAQLRQSALWAYVQPMLAQRADVMDMFKTVCGLDPSEVIDEAELAMDPDGGSNSLVMVVKGSFGRATVDSCLNAMAAKQGETVTIQNDGAVASYSDGNQTLWAGWPDDHTIVLGDENHDHAWVEARLAGTDSLRDDDAFIDVLGNVDTSSTAWLAYMDQSGQLAMLAGTFGGRAPSAVYAWLTVTDSAKGEVGLVFPAEGDAKVAANSLQTMLDQVKGDPTMGAIVSGARVGVYGTNAVIEIELDKQQLSQVLAILGTLPI